MKKIILLVLSLFLTVPVYAADTKGSALTDGSGSVAGGDFLLGYTTTGPASRRYTINSILGLKTSVSGNAGTATALAADPAGCAGGQVTTDINASGVASCTTWSANMLSLLGSADYSTARTNLGLAIGTDVQAYNSNLTAINQALTNTSNPAFSTLNLTGAGLTIGTGSTTTGLLQIKNATNNNILTVQPGATGSNWSLTWPVSPPAGNDYLVTASTAGVLSYTDPSTLGSGASVSDTAYDATTWDGVTTAAPSKNAVRDYLESIIPTGADGSKYLEIGNNTTRDPDASKNQLYPEANIWKANQNGTESSIAIGPTAGQVSFTGPTVPRSYALPDAAATLLYSGGAGGTPSSLDLTNAVVASGTSPPGTCTTGQMYLDTDADTNGSLYTCIATNTWKEVDDDGGAGGMATTDIDTSAELVTIVTDETGSATGTPKLVFNQAPRIDNIELGADTDTTITRPAAGQIAVEGNVLLGKSTPIVQCAIIPAAVAADDYPIFKAPAALTIVAGSIHVYAVGGTNVIGGLDECTGTNGVCSGVTAIDADITGTAGSDVADDGVLTNGAIASGNWIQWHTTSVSGTNTSLSVCFSYTLD